MQPRHPNISPHGHLPQSLYIKNTKQTDLGVRGELKKAIKLADKTFPRGTKVIIQPLNRLNPGPQEFIITPYERDNSPAQMDLPEAQRQVKTDKSYHIRFPRHMSAKDYLIYSDEHYAFVRKELFPRKESPSIEEVKQMYVPDCSLLAVIQAILTHPHGASFIRGMMYQDERGLVTVRLFDPKTSEPVYVKVMPAILMGVVEEKAVSLSGHGALWAHVLESAFAALGNKDYGQEVDQSVSSVCAFIIHDVAFKTLTGLSSTRNNLESYSITPSDIPNCLSEAAQNEVKTARTMAEFKQGVDLNQATLSLIKNAIENEIFMNDLRELFLKEMKEDEVLTQYAKLVLLQEYEPAKFKEIIEGKSPDTELMSFYFKIKKFLKTPGEPFADDYNAFQQKTYDDLREALAQGKLVTASTPEKYPKPVTGLHANHAYTILDVVRRKQRVVNKLGVINDVYANFVVMRNPWGESGRAYTMESGIAFDDRQSGKFEIELSEFCANFLCYTVTESADRSFLRDHTEEKYLEKIEDFLRSIEIQASASITEIAGMNNACLSCLANLTELELLELNRIDQNSLTILYSFFDPTIAEEHEKRSICPAIDVKLFSHIQGTDEEIREHIFSLLKLQWLKTQNPRDLVKEQQLVEKISTHLAYPKLWEKLKNREASLNMIIYNNINSFRNVNYEMITELHTAMGRISLEHEIKLDRETTESIEYAIQCYFDLKANYHKFNTLFMLIKNREVTDTLTREMTELDGVLKRYESDFTNAATDPYIKNRFEASNRNYELRGKQRALDLGVIITNPQAENIFEDPELYLGDEQESTRRQHFGRRTLPPRNLFTKIIETVVKPAPKGPPKKGGDGPPV